MKRILTLFLALMLVVSCFAFTACKGDDGKGGTDKPSTDKDSDTDKELDLEDIGDLIVDSEATLDIPSDLNYNGYVCNVFAPDPYGPSAFYTDALNNTPVNDALYNRNLKMEDTLGVKIEAISLDTSAGNQSQKFIDEVLAGNHSFDFAAVHSTSACAALIMANAVLSFDNLEYVDFSKPWWDNGLAETCSVMGENYFALSPMCKGYYTNTSCILFNKDLAQEANLPNLYDIVKKGDWTVDKVIEITRNFSEDLNNDGIFNEEDKLAIVSDDTAYMNFWLGAFRQSTISKGENDEPTITANSSRMQNAIEKLNSLFHTGRRGIVYDMSDRIDGDDEWLRAFAEGRILFQVCIVGNAVGLRDHDINFGILPLPKLNSDQERYGSWVDPWGLILCVPSNCEDTERTGAILEAMSYHSYHMLYPAIIQQSIYGSGARDMESIEMLEIIYDNMFFDFGFVFDGNGNGYGDIMRTLVPENSTDISSYIATKRNQVEDHFSNLYEKMLDNYD